MMLKASPCIFIYILSTRNCCFLLLLSAFSVITDVVSIFMIPIDSLYYTYVLFFILFSFLVCISKYTCLQCIFFPMTPMFQYMKQYKGTPRSVQNYPLELGRKGCET